MKMRKIAAMGLSAVMAASMVPALPVMADDAAGKVYYLNFKPEQDLCLMMKQVEEACAKANVQVMGGHTEVTRVVNQPVISVCGVGKVKKGHLISTAGARPGMDILVSKWIGIEGTSIIAKEKEEELKTHFAVPFIEKAKALVSFQ